MGKVFPVKAIAAKGKCHVPVLSPPANKPQYALNTRQGGPYSRSAPFEGEKNILPCAGIEGR